MSLRPPLALYSLAHLWVDLSCALLVLRTLSGGPYFGLCLLLYNFCAFALQMPLGLLADRLDRNGLLSAAGCALTALAYLAPMPVLAAVTAGVGNALFHLGGGLDVLNGGGPMGPPRRDCWRWPWRSSGSAAAGTAPASAPATPRRT